MLINKYVEQIPNRVETLELSFTIKDENTFNKVAGIFSVNPALQNNDTLNLKISIEYYNVCRQLQTIVDLLDNNSIDTIKSTELTTGKCLIQDMLLKIEQIEHKLTKE